MGINLVRIKQAADGSKYAHGGTEFAHGSIESKHIVP